MRPIIGDLLEEYREVVLPARGRARAAIWFMTQLAGLVKPWMWGVIIGLVFGIENLVSTAISPLAEDTPALMLTLVTVVLGSWILVGFSAGRRTMRVRDAVLAGVVVATISMSLFGMANWVRVTVFLDVIKDRSDWVGLMDRFHASGAPDLRSFVMSEYSRGNLLSTAVIAGIGGAMGALGGLVGVRRHRASTR